LMSAYSCSLTRGRFKESCQRDRLKKLGREVQERDARVHVLFCVSVCRCTWLKHGRILGPWRTMMCPVILVWWLFHLLKNIAPDSLIMSYTCNLDAIQNSASTQTRSIPSYDRCTRSWCGPQDNRRAQTSSTPP
jgi:hypothetical protein